MANRQTVTPPSFFNIPPTPSNSSTINHPPSTLANSSQPTSSSISAAQYPANQSHTQLWLSSSHRLSEIEAGGSAVAEESSVFGPAHARALEELRTAQLQLAQAWMRSECEDLLDGEHAELAKRSFGRDVEQGGRSGGDGAGDGVREAVGTQQGGAVGESAPGGTAPAEIHGLGGYGASTGGMEMDTLLARKRRELNDAHFNRVSLSVVDVIQKLENVASAMGVVETESRDMWGSEVSDISSTK